MMNMVVVTIAINLLLTLLLLRNNIESDFHVQNLK